MNPRSVSNSESLFMRWAALLRSVRTMSALGFFLVLGSISCVFAMESPLGTNLFPEYAAVPGPVLDSNPAQARPIGFGSSAAGGSFLDLTIETEPYDSPVDAYAAIWSPAYFGNEMILLTENGFQLISGGISPWKRNVTQVTGTLFSGVGASSLTTSDYTVCLLTVPAGTPLSSLGNNCHWWSTTLSLFLIRDVESLALQLFFSQVDAGLAILYAMDGGQSLEGIASAIMAGTLPASGPLTGSRKSALSHLTGDDSDCQTPWDSELCRQQFTNEVETFINKGDVGVSVVKMIVSLADVGYSAEQIENLIVEYVLGTKKLDADHWYIEDCSQDPCEIIRPARVPPGVFADLSGTWVDFDFSAVKSCQYSIRVGLAGYTAYEGAEPDLLQGSGYGLGSLSAIKSEGATTAYNGDFEYTQPGFYGASTDNAIEVSIYRYGAALVVEALLLVKNLEGKSIGARKFQSTLPLLKITEKGDKPALEYGAVGTGACNAFEGFQLFNQNGVYNTDLMFCDELSSLYVWLMVD